MNPEHPQAFQQTFTFQHWQFDPACGQLTLCYEDSQYGPFTERYMFPGVDANRYHHFQQVIDAAFDCLFWMAGVSYYKTSLAQDIQFKGRVPSALQSEWLSQTWQAGLAEMAHQNQLGWLHHIQFNQTSNNKQTAEIALQPRSLVAIGGGKDSLVSIEAIKDMAEPAAVFMVGQSAFIQSVAARTALPLVAIERQVDERLRDVNQQGAYNGHVPITAINACVACATALLLDYDAVVFSNERSADAGNLQADNGQWVNHQYSKSMAYERQWQQVINQCITPQLNCFSLLRPFSELAIVKRFAVLQQYFPYFSSCNRNFHLAGSQNAHHHWCGQCPKCAFVFLCLAPFISEAEIMRIFQKDLFADDALNELFDALLGIAGNKPFECVGEQQECRAAVKLLADHEHWSKHPRVQLWQSILPQLQDHDLVAIMQPSKRHMIPAIRSFQSVLSA